MVLENIATVNMSDDMALGLSEKKIRIPEIPKN